MAAPIGPGDWVECVDDRGDGGIALHDGGFLVLGRIYQIDELMAAQTTLAGLVPAVRLVGQPFLHARSWRRRAYALSRFRPIYRPKSDLIESLKQPAPPVERELIAAD